MLRSFTSWCEHDFGLARSCVQNETSSRKLYVNMFQNAGSFLNGLVSLGDASKGHAISSHARGSIRCVTEADSVVAKALMPVQVIVGDNSSWQKIVWVVSSTSEMSRLKIRSAKISPGRALFAD